MTTPHRQAPAAKGLLGASASCPLPDPYTPGHGCADFQVFRYELYLNYGVSTNRLSGHAAITARSSVDLATVTLNLAGRPGRLF